MRGPVVLSIALALMGAGPAVALAGSDETTAIYANPAHDGLVTGSTLAPPLQPRWAVDFGPFSVDPYAYGEQVARTSYPLVAGGRVFVVVYRGGGSELVALDLADGRALWSRALSGGGVHAYDGGRVFVVQGAGVLEAYDAATGNTVWAKQLGGQWSFGVPPVAAGGSTRAGPAPAGPSMPCRRRTARSSGRGRSPTVTTPRRHSTHSASSSPTSVRRCTRSTV